MNDIIVLGVGLVVSIMVVYGIFSRVVHEMRDARNNGAKPPKSEDQPVSS